MPTLPNGEQVTLSDMARYFATKHAAVNPVPQYYDHDVKNAVTNEQLHETFGGVQRILT